MVQPNVTTHKAVWKISIIFRVGILIRNMVSLSASLLPIFPPSNPVEPAGDLSHGCAMEGGPQTGSKGFGSVEATVVYTESANSENRGDITKNQLEFVCTIPFWRIPLKKLCLLWALQTLKLEKLDKVLFCSHTSTAPIARHWRRMGPFHDERHQHLQAGKREDSEGRPIHLSPSEGLHL